MKIFKSLDRKRQILLLAFYPSVLFLLIFSITYGNATRINIEKYLDNRNSCLYVYKKADENYNLSELEQMSKIITQENSQIYVNMNSDIEITSNKYAFSQYKLSNNNQIIFNRTIQNENKNIGYPLMNYAAITYNEKNKPLEMDIIKKFPNEDGVYINQSFLNNAHIKMNEIDKNTFIEFSVHVPIKTGIRNMEIVNPEITNFVHSVTIKKKISGIIKDNIDLQIVAYADNLVLYPVEECINLMNKYKSINIDSKISSQYKYIDLVPSSYILNYDRLELQNKYNKIKSKINIDLNEVQIYSQYYNKMMLLDKISNIQNNLKNISKGLLIIIFISFLYSLKINHKHDEKNTVKCLIKQGLQSDKIIDYLHWERRLFSLFVVFLPLFNIVVLNIILKFMYIDIDTNLIVCFIIMFFYGLLMEIALYRHMKKQELLINNEKTRKKDSIDFK
ncbi:MAG: hypothetical protein KHZ15_03045 [Coprobacillus cateniformis]|uniref:hypothetical protein n=1 Tax=Longibaculum muris TaxID=1796628 RepID=UPI003AB1CD5D|nr:hypothetical protein [Coprobacillus cateniformis]